MKRISVLLAVVVFLVGCVSALNAAATIYGMSGLIETPDDTIVPARSLTLTANRLFSVGDSDVDLTTFGGAFGILPNLEVSAVGFDSSASGVATQAIINGKFRVLAESVDKPSVTVGIMDITKELDSSDMSMFIVVGKNITDVAEDVSGQVSKPVKATLGYGTGLYHGLFGGLDLSVAPKFSVAVEYLTRGVRDKSTFNGCVRFQPTQALSISVGAIGFRDLYVGASFNLSAF